MHYTSINGLSGVGDILLYVVNDKYPTTKHIAEVINSRTLGGNGLMKEDAPKKNAMNESAAKVLLLNIFFWYILTYISILTAGCGAPD